MMVRVRGGRWGRYMVGAGLRGILIVAGLLVGLIVLEVSVRVLPVRQREWGTGQTQFGANLAEFWET